MFALGQRAALKLVLQRAFGVTSILSVCTNSANSTSCVLTLTPFFYVKKKFREKGFLNFTKFFALWQNSL